MAIREVDLPQKQQLPRRLRDSARNDEELRSLRDFFPINGTPLNGEPTPLSPERRRQYHLRKEQKARAKALARARASEGGGEGEASGSGEKRLKGKGRFSSPNGGPSIFPPPTPVPQGEYHSWSIHDPLSSAVQVHKRHPATHKHTVPNHPTYSPLPSTPAGAPDHHADSALFSPVHAQSPAGCHESHGMSAAPPSVDNALRLESALSTEPANGWCTDSFVTAYQSYFVPHSLDSRDRNQALAQGLSEHHVDTPHWAVREPASLAYAGATMVPASTMSATMYEATAKQGHRNVSRGPCVASTTRFDNGEPTGIACSAPPVVVAQIDHDLAHKRTGTANDKALEVPNRLPAAIYSNMHPIPLRISSYSELAHALDFPASAFVDYGMPSRVDTLAATSKTTAFSASTDASLHVQPSESISGIYSPDPVYLTRPYGAQEIAVNEYEYAHVPKGCFDDRGPLSADIVSLSSGADPAEGQGPPAAAAVGECARTIQEGITRSDRVLSMIESLLVNMGLATDNTFHEDDAGLPAATASISSSLWSL